MARPSCIIHDYAPVSSVTEWFAGEWFATGCSQILIFSFPLLSSGLGQHGDTTRRPFSPPPPPHPFLSFPFFLHFSFSLPPRDTRTHANRDDGLIPYVERAVLRARAVRERDEIIIAKHLHYKVVVSRVSGGGL